MTNDCAQIASLTGLIALDHVMVAVKDHEIATNRWQRLGFKVRPVRQLVPMGGGSAGGNGGSAAVLLRSKTEGVANFIELAKADPVTAAPALKTLLCGDEGVAMLVHATNNPALTKARFESLGLQCQSMHIKLPPIGDGDEVLVDIVLPTPRQTPRTFNAMRMSSTADFERDEWRGHPNSALSWIAITYIETPLRIAETIDSFRRLYGSEPAKNGDEAHFSFQIDEVRLDVTTEQNLAMRLGTDCPFGTGDTAAAALLEFEVANLDSARNYLNTNAVPYTDLGDTIVVSASELLGVATLFRAG